MTQVVSAPGERRLTVESVGDPDGKPVFLLHGTPGGRNGPRPRGIVLARRGIRLISYDRPGYPESDRLLGRKVRDAADDVKIIADHFGIDRFSVIGRSGGAPHALACAAVLGKERVICVAALGSLAPYGAGGLEWGEWIDGMAESNVRVYQNASNDKGALIATLKEQAGQVQRGSEGLLKMLWPDLVGHDKDVVGDIALRQLIAGVHVQALDGTADGWIDDVVALSQPWGFDLSDIALPVKLWSGSDDVFSPTAHTKWLAQRIDGADLQIDSGKAHFGAVEILPEILTWVADKANLAIVPA